MVSHCKPLWAFLALCCASLALARPLAGRDLKQDVGSVCGVDGITYSSAEEAAASKVLTAYPGECSEATSGCTGSSWDPVCVDGTDGPFTVANKCFAAAAYPGAVFDKGNCKLASCSCAFIFSPVCGVSGVTYSNECELGCSEDIFDHAGSCSTDTQEQPTDEEDNLDGTIEVSAHEEEVGNAHGSGAASGSGGSGTGSGSGSGSGSGGCFCPEIYNPVCGTDNIEYPNACKARCAGVDLLLDAPCACVLCPNILPTPKTIVCGVNNVTYETPCAATCRGVEIDYPAPCGPPCPEGPAVCGIDGKTYKSECHADRKDVKVGLHEPCPVIPPECSGDEGNITDPICVLAPGAYFGKTYKNGCFAKAAGANLSKGYTYYRGECQTQCDLKCNMQNGTDFQSFRPATTVACCGNGLEYPNQCYAQCVGKWTNSDLTKVCERTFCKQGRALRALANVGNCPPGAPVFKCEKFGCVLQRTCPKDKDAKCVHVNPCTKFFRLDYLDQPCSGNFVAKTGSINAQCFKAGIIDDGAHIANDQCVPKGGPCTPDAVSVEPAAGWRLCCTGVCQTGLVNKNVGKCVDA